MNPTNLNFGTRIFMESVCGVAVASLGQIVEGWTVVFGTEEQINLRNLSPPRRAPFLDFVYAARRRVERRFGPTVMFEHGACAAGTSVSCGVDRMHVHVVPFRCESLIGEIEKKYKCIANSATLGGLFEEMQRWSTEGPYFWVEDGRQLFLFSYGEKRESQVVRRAIANLVGLADQWNWREFPTAHVAERIAADLITDSGARRHLEAA